MKPNIKEKSSKIADSILRNLPTLLSFLFGGIALLSIAKMILP